MSDQFQIIPPPFRPQFATATTASAATKAATRTGYAESHEKKIKNLI